MVPVGEGNGEPNVVSWSGMLILRGWIFLLGGDGTRAGGGSRSSTRDWNWILMFVLGNLSVHLLGRGNEGRVRRTLLWLLGMSCGAASKYNVLFIYSTFILTTVEMFMLRNLKVCICQGERMKVKWEGCCFLHGNQYDLTIIYTFILTMADLDVYASKS